MESTTIESVERKWGEYITYLTNCEALNTIKLLIIDAGQSTSLQLHSQRGESWIPINGPLHVFTGDNKYITIEPFEQLSIPAWDVHRLHNPNSHEILIIEIITGFYDEEDIVRIEP